MTYSMLANRGKLKQFTTGSTKYHQEFMRGPETVSTLISPKELLVHQPATREA
jgi:hypothetical protein